MRDRSERSAGPRPGSDPTAREHALQTAVHEGDPLEAAQGEGADVLAAACEQGERAALAALAQASSEGAEEREAFLGGRSEPASTPAVAECSHVLALLRVDRCRHGGHDG